MKKLIPLLGFAALAAATIFGLSFPVHAAEQKPNIIYILSDDQGWKDVGYHGSNIKTPNIDRLAATGVRLEQFMPSQCARQLGLH